MSGFNINLTLHVLLDPTHLIVTKPPTLGKHSSFYLGNVRVSEHSEWRARYSLVLLQTVTTAKAFSISIHFYLQQVTPTAM